MEIKKVTTPKAKTKVPPSGCKESSLDNSSRKQTNPEVETHVNDDAVSASTQRKKTTKTTCCMCGELHYCVNCAICSCKVCNYCAVGIYCSVDCESASTDYTSNESDTTQIIDTKSRSVSRTSVTHYETVESTPTRRSVTTVEEPGVKKSASRQIKEVVSNAKREVKRHELFQRTTRAGREPGLPEGTDSSRTITNEPKQDYSFSLLHEKSTTTKELDSLEEVQAEVLIPIVKPLEENDSFVAIAPTKFNVRVTLKPFSGCLFIAGLEVNVQSALRELCKHLLQVYKSNQVAGPQTHSILVCAENLENRSYELKIRVEEGKKLHKIMAASAEGVCRVFQVAQESPSYNPLKSQEAIVPMHDKAYLCASYLTLLLSQVIHHHKSSSYHFAISLGSLKWRKEIRKLAGHDIGALFSLSGNDVQVKFDASVPRTFIETSNVLETIKYRDKPVEKYFTYFVMDIVDGVTYEVTINEMNKYEILVYKETCFVIDRCTLTVDNQPPQKDVRAKLTRMSPVENKKMAKFATHIKRDFSNGGSDLSTFGMKYGLVLSPRYLFSCKIIVSPRTTIVVEKDVLEAVEQIHVFATSQDLNQKMKSEDALDLGRFLEVNNDIIDMLDQLKTCSSLL